MTTAFRVGVFAVGAILATFVVWYVLNNVSLRKGSYPFAVHFRNVVGLQPGSEVQLAGVDIGIIDSINILPQDQTAEVVCSIQNDYTLYHGSVFTVAQTLTGAQSTLTIIPPPNLATAQPWPKKRLPYGQQPEGTTPTTIADLVSEGQARLNDLDKTLALVNQELPGIVKNFNGVAVHTNNLIVHADRNFNLLGQQLNGTMGGVNAIVAQLNGLLTTNGQNVSAMTTEMKELISSSGPKVVALIDNLDATSTNLNKTMVSVESLATDPSLKANLVGTTENLKESSEKLKQIATDIQSVTGDPKVQAQMRNTIQNLDDTIAKANDILGTFSTAQGAGAPTPGQIQPAPVGSVPPGGPAPPPQHAQAAGFHMGHVAFNPGELVTGNVRLNWQSLHSGPYSDVELNVLPHFPTHFSLGANGLGSQNTTYNVLVDQRGSPNLQYSFGVLYSNLGARAVWSGLGPLGIDARLYNSAWPRLDLYGDLRLTQRLMFFYGERSVIGPASTRVLLGGVQLGQ
ncbi:MAG: MCE family protein [Candidatus Eremiobacteraeota bacterium]|nr:MCE family protein [Candidatus Eremiobacteraeota bacterium]MBV8670014.1 MCE family protein [Candidatus Eremiobacteraeota bacterium]